MEDPELVRVLRERQIPLDVCPTSNICLKVFPSLDQHPLPRMMAAGLNVTLNSDDPPLFNTSLTKEYTLALQYLGLDIESLQGLVNNGIRAALLPEERKQALLNAFARENAALAARFG
jgi:adenosine deaminase